MTSGAGPREKTKAINDGVLPRCERRWHGLPPFFYDRTSDAVAGATRFPGRVKMLGKTDTHLRASRGKPIKRLFQDLTADI